MTAEMVEAEGFRVALDCPICSSGSSYMVEGDAQTVIRMLQGRAQVKASLDVIIADTLFFA